MKKISTLFLVLAIALSTFGIASAAAPAPGGPFVSAFYVQNISTTAATCIFVFYDGTGSLAYTSDEFAVGAESNYEVYTPSLTDVASGAYSAVVSCDQPAQAIVNFSDSNSAASHSGVSLPADTWFAPNVYDNFYGYYSNVYVQNATADPIDVTLEIYGPDPVNPGTIIMVYTTTEVDVPGFTSVVFEQEGLTQLANNKSYSGKIIATGDAAAIVNIYNTIQLYSYNPFAGGATEAFVPALYNNYYGFNTEMKIQNVGASDADVLITYSNGVTDTVTLIPNSGKAFYTPSNPNIPKANKAYTAFISSDQPIVVVVNESNATNKAATYSGFTDGAAKVSIPAVMKDYYGYDTEVNCMNVGAATTDVTISYTIKNDPNIYETTKLGVEAGKNATFYTPADPALATAVTKNKKISAIVTTTGEPLNCIVNESHRTLTGDTQYSYNAFPVAP